MWTVIKLISKGDYNYCKIKETHSKATSKGYILHHRIIMENHLNRLLNDNEIIHHKDNNKKNNKIDNLEIMDFKEHCTHHGKSHLKNLVELKCPICKKIFIIAKNQSFLIKKNKYNCNCCSRNCGGVLSTSIQYGTISNKTKLAMKNNFIREFKGKI